MKAALKKQLICAEQVAAVDLLQHIIQAVVIAVSNDSLVILCDSPN